MIEQCLSNKNKSATVSKSQKFCELNEAWIKDDQHLRLCVLALRVQLYVRGVGKIPFFNVCAKNHDSMYWEYFIKLSN